MNGIEFAIARMSRSLEETATTRPLTEAEEQLRDVVEVEVVAYAAREAAEPPRQTVAQASIAAEVNAPASPRASRGRKARTEPRGQQIARDMVAEALARDMIDKALRQVAPNLEHEITYRLERRREAMLMKGIDRCQREIAAIENRPDDVKEKAFLATMGIEDWYAEIRLIEQEARGRC